jgi:hypothetical protein
MNGNGRAWGTAHDGKRQQRALLASATQLGGPQGLNRTEGKRLGRLRQPWQEDAWAYRDAIGELRYATTFLGNANRKIMLVPSAYVEGELDPLPLSEIADCPDQVRAAANDALRRLSSGGPLAMSALQRDIAENFEVAGECFLLGWPPQTVLPDKDNAEEIWEIRSVSEITSNNDGNIQLREEGSAQAEDIPNGVFIQRLWYPHPRKKSLADSPFAAILDTCEELLILSRDIRASGRSRLANSGLLLLPDKLTVVKANTQEDANDSQQDEFMQELIAAGMAAIQDEGSASAIFPIVIRGPQDALAAVRQLQISRPDAQRAQDRSELITRMATALDLPAEVLTGKGDLNHWTAWSVSDDTFNEHIEPLVMVIDDALTAGYLRIALQEYQIDPVWANRVILWHDATRLVRHPDRSQDAMSAYDRFALSDAALRDTMGFSDTDKPDEIEMLSRLAMKQSRLDPTIIAQIIKRMDNSIDITGVRSDGGIDRTGAAPEQPDAGAPGDGGPSAGIPRATEGPPENGQPQQQAPANTPPGLAAAASPKGPTEASIKRGNKQLAKIEKELYDKLLTASNAAMSRALEKAGARIRTAVGRTAAGRAWCASHSNTQLCFLISNSMIAAAGLDEMTLLNEAWDSLESEYGQYLEYADSQTINALAKMVGKTPAEFKDLANSLSDYAGEGWKTLRTGLNKQAISYLSDAASQLEMDDVDEAAEITKTRLVSPKLVKSALSRAGGAPLHPKDAQTFDPTVSVAVEPGLTTGPAVAETIGNEGMGIESYTWIHGFTPNPFEPHVDLDGVEFANWTDEALLNNDEWPDVDYFIPGDHDGCSCDFAVNWGNSGTSETEEQQSVAQE